MADFEFLGGSMFSKSPDMSLVSYEIINIMKKRSESKKEEGDSEQPKKKTKLIDDDSEQPKADDDSELEVR